jgi:hypothetical protein
MYFYFKEYRAINNDRDSGLFDRPFDVDPEKKDIWAKSGKSIELAPELITYWKDE